jgi:hypothetical protein
MTKRLVCLILLFTGAAAMVWAGCKSDCADEYQSAVESCKLLYDEPSDSDSLKLCIESAKDDYDSCIEECDN